MVFERFKAAPPKPSVKATSAEAWLAAHRNAEAAFGGVLVVLLLTCAAYLYLA